MFSFVNFHRAGHSHGTNTQRTQCTFPCLNHWWLLIACHTNPVFFTACVGSFMIQHLQTSPLPPSLSLSLVFRMLSMLTPTSGLLHVPPTLPEWPYLSLFSSSLGFRMYLVVFSANYCQWTKEINLPVCTKAQ